MSATSPAIIELLKERLQFVQDISLLNARHLLNQQLAGGAEFTIAQIEREMAECGVEQARSAALEEARERHRQANAAMADCDENLTALERQLKELDQRIAAG
jgi:hypothetical protein